MAIKLADIIENVNSNYPVIDASIGATTGGSIKGFGIFQDISARDSVPADKRCYGYVAVVLFADGGNNQISSVDSTYDFTTTGNLPQYDADNDGTVNFNDTAAFLGISGTVISSAADIYGFGTSTRVYIYKTQPHGIIATSSGNAADFFSPDNNVSASLQDVTSAISLVDWEDVDNWEEITIGGGGYNAIGSESFANNADKYRLTLYDKINKVNRALEADSLMAWITQTLIEAIVSAGYGSTTLYTNPATGVLGDFNGDGNVGVSDLLIFLGSFGQSLGGAINPELIDTSVNNTGGALTDINNALEAAQLALGNPAWSGIPTVDKFTNGGSDYQTPIFFSGGSTTVVAGAFDVTTTIGSSGAQRSTVTFSEGTDANDPDWDVSFPKLRLTGFALVGWGRLYTGIPSAVGFVWRIIFKNSSNTTILTKYRRFEKDITSSSPVGGLTDAVPLLDGVVDPTAQDTSSQVVLVDLTLTDNSVTGPGIPSNISTSDIATVTLELDYYVPNADSAIYYQVTPGFTLILDEG